MEIIINSLYSNKDIFVRELISNAADALDKIRFLAVAESSQLGEGDDANLEIRISYDADKKILSIRDRGVGMTKDDLIANLGTIARSGTAAFLEQAQKGGDLNLIGQFGVGFYSVYLVADYVEVITKHNDDAQWVWESRASGHFAISQDADGEPLGRGTLINIHLKDSCLEYLQESKLKELVQRYSEFISFPIYLRTEREESKEVPIEEDDDVPAAAEDKDDGIDEEKEDLEEGQEIEVEDDDAEPKPKTKTVTETIVDWALLNDAKALWLRTPGNVSDEEYDKFYKVLVKNEVSEPVAHTHFKAEGDVDFKAVLYAPNAAPAGEFTCVVFPWNPLLPKTRGAVAY
jgi:heat shock protein 90kDa beta